MRFEPAVSTVVALTVDHPEVSNDALASGINDTSLRVVTSGYWIAIAPSGMTHRDLRGVLFKWMRSHSILHQVRDPILVGIFGISKV